jgi:hypothetical protein
VLAALSANRRYENPLGVSPNYNTRHVIGPVVVIDEPKPKKVLRKKKAQ